MGTKVSWGFWGQHLGMKTMFTDQDPHIQSCKVFTVQMSLEAIHLPWGGTPLRRECVFSSLHKGALRAGGRAVTGQVCDTHTGPCAHAGAPTSEVIAVSPA